MSTSIVQVYNCPCNPRHTYPSKSAFGTHKKSNRHKAWEFGQQSEKIEAKRRDDEIFTLNLKIKDREELIEKLITEKVKLLEIQQKYSEFEHIKKENKQLKIENSKLTSFFKKDV